MIEQLLAVKLMDLLSDTGQQSWPVSGKKTNNFNRLTLTVDVAPQDCVAALAAHVKAAG